jgi:two-component system response regulator DesR
MLRVLLADSDATFRDPIATLFGMRADVSVVAQVSRCGGIVTAARTSQAEVALVDIDLPEAGGYQAVRELRRHVPDCHALMMTTFGRPNCIDEALKAGASGIVVKDLTIEQLSNALRQTAEGRRVIDATVFS